MRATSVESKAILPGNAKTVPTGSATIVVDMDISLENVVICVFKLPRGVSRNHRPVDSPMTSKNCDFTNISLCNVSSLPEHPFVACFVDSVPVNALVDTRSMKCFISDRILSIIDFNCAKLNKLQPQRYTSIAGGGTITFQRSKHIS